MTPKGLAELLGELPASERAALSWAPQALTTSLERLFTAPQLSDALLEEIGASLFEQNRALLKVIPGMAAEGQRFSEHMRPGWEERAHVLRALPVGIRRPAARALATCHVVVGIGLSMLEDSKAAPPGLPSSAPDPKVIADAKAMVAVAGILHGIETGRALEARTKELIKVADEEASRLAKMLAEASPPLRLGWYFEDAPDAPEYRPIATWAEAETSKNDRALQMLEEWDAEPEEPGEAESWEKLKRALDEDRPSNRPLFP